MAKKETVSVFTVVFLVATGFMVGGISLWKYFPEAKIFVGLSSSMYVVLAIGFLAWAWFSRK